MLVNCLRCNQKPVIKNVYGQYTISCKCGVKQGHLFFNRNIAIDNWNKYAYKYLVAAAGNNKDRLAVEYVIHSEVEEDAKELRRKELLIKAGTDYLTAAEAADLARVGGDRIYRAAYAKELVSRRFKGVLKFRKDDIIKWRKNNPPKSEVLQERLKDILG